MSCSFLNIVGGVCGAEERARHPSTQTVSLSSCSKDMRSHKRFLQFSGVETEIELILARSGIFVKPVNFSEMTVCPLRRSNLGIGWRRASSLCSVPRAWYGFVFSFSFISGVSFVYSFIIYFTALWLLGHATFLLLVVATSSNFKDLYKPARGITARKRYVVFYCFVFFVIFH